MSEKRVPSAIYAVHSAKNNLSPSMVYKKRSNYSLPTLYDLNVVTATGFYYYEASLLIRSLTLEFSSYFFSLRFSKKKSTKQDCCTVYPVRDSGVDSQFKFVHFRF